MFENFGYSEPVLQVAKKKAFAIKKFLVLSCRLTKSRFCKRKWFL